MLTSTDESEVYVARNEKQKKTYHSVSLFQKI